MQTKLMSVVETLSSIAIGFVISFLSQTVIFPLYDIHTTMAQNLEITLYFTVISVIRSYAVRRWFNSMRIKT